MRFWIILFVFGVFSTVSTALEMTNVTTPSSGPDADPDVGRYFHLVNSKTLHFRIEKLIENATETNSLIELRLRATVGLIGFELFHCGSLLFSSKNRLRRHDFKFGREWIDFLAENYAKKCARKHVAATHGIIVHTNVPTYIHVIWSLRKEFETFNSLASPRDTVSFRLPLFSLDPQNQMMVLQTRTTLSHKFTPDDRITLIVNSTTPIEIGFEKCNVAFPNLVSTKKLKGRHEIKLNQRKVRMFYLIRNLSCNADQTNSFETVIYSRQNNSGFITFHIALRKSLVTDLFLPTVLIIMIVVGIAFLCFSQLRALVGNHVFPRQRNQPIEEELHEWSKIHVKAAQMYMANIMKQ